MKQNLDEYLKSISNKKSDIKEPESFPEVTTPENKKISEEDAKSQIPVERPEIDNNSRESPQFPTFTAFGLKRKTKDRNENNDQESC